MFAFFIEFGEASFEGGDDFKDFVADRARVDFDVVVDEGELAK